MTPVAQLAQNNHRLILLLGISFVCLAILMIFVTMIATKAIILSNRRLAQRYESLRAETLAEFIKVQRVENERLIAETRAVTARVKELLDQWPK